MRSMGKPFFTAPKKKAPQAVLAGSHGGLGYSWAGAVVVENLDHGFRCTDLPEIGFYLFGERRRISVEIKGQLALGSRLDRGLRPLWQQLRCPPPERCYPPHVIRPLRPAPGRFPLKAIILKGLERDGLRRNTALGAECHELPEAMESHVFGKLFQQRSPFALLDLWGGGTPRGQQAEPPQYETETRAKVGKGAGLKPHLGRRGGFEEANAPFGVQSDAISRTALKGRDRGQGAAEGSAPAGGDVLPGADRRDCGGHGECLRGAGGAVMGGHVAESLAWGVDFM